ncbi:IS3 family transposase [Corynebacterium pseudodiphtheriticum]|uniref:IS3 family transposase n=1 Tax=Corynebacterium pseudodiphtheriticum TaxID=37637 RepID=UPI003AF2AA5C
MSVRRLRDAVLFEHLRQVHADNYGVYGVRKMWHALRRKRIDIGREQTARLMCMAGLSGKGKGFAYTAFVTDVFSRRIVGWELCASWECQWLLTRTSSSIPACGMMSSTWRLRPSTG